MTNTMERIRQDERSREEMSGALRETNRAVEETNGAMGEMTETRGKHTTTETNSKAG